ncbi:MAG: hypothetical protein ACMUIU_02000 [bacterium]
MKYKYVFIILTVLIFACLSISVYARTIETPIFMPGTQPMEVMNITGSTECRVCHGGYDRSIESTFNWEGIMMAQASKDPLMYAALAIANQDIPDAGDLCLRCHVPNGWLRGNSVPTDGSKFTPQELEGIQCDFCHRVVNPLSEEGKALVEPNVDKLESGKYVISPEKIVRGPYTTIIAVHDSTESDFHKTGDFCGVCHDVTNPIFINPVTGQPAAVERTYSEWKNSDFAKIGAKGSCQNCHMPPKWGTASDPKRFDTSFQQVIFRDYLNIHEFVGGNTFAQQILPMFWNYDKEGLEALQNTRDKAYIQLRKAATIDLDFYNEPAGKRLKVTVTNHTGHKLPTGYPEGRRMWINVKAFDAAGDQIFESGKYDFDTGELIKDKQIKVYEIKPGVSPKQAERFGLTPGPTFHFILNDMVYKDNRIPPRGFTNAAFQAIGAEVVDYQYEDGQFWDETYYSIPETTAKVEVALYYQTSSKEYIEFLRAENKTNDLGEALYMAWEMTTKSMPVDTMGDNKVAGNSCRACHGDLKKMTDLGYPQFYFDWTQVNAETGMSASCEDCHLGSPKDFTLEGAHKGLLGLLVMKGIYRDVVRRKDVAGDDYGKVRSLKSIRESNSDDPRYRLRVQSPFHMLLWHDKNQETSAWNPEIAMKTCGRCHARQVAEFVTTEMGLNLTMSQYDPWIVPPQPEEPGTHLKIAPQSCGLWTELAVKPDNETFTETNRELYNSTSTKITPQFEDPVYPETSNDPLTKLQSLANTKNCIKCHPGCLDCHFVPFAEDIPGRMGIKKPAGTHTFTQRPLLSNCMGGGRGQFCHGGPIDRRRGDGYLKGGFAHVPRVENRTEDTKAYLDTPDIHYNGDKNPSNAICVDCHGPLPGRKDYGLIGGDPDAIHGNMDRSPEPERCAVCHPKQVAGHHIGNHKNLTCGACHTVKVAGYAFNFWAPGTRFGITPNPLDRHERYAVNAMNPVLLKDEDGVWTPYHVVPHISTHIDPDYLDVNDYLSPRILWRNQPDIGVYRQHRANDCVAVTGSYFGPDYGRDEGQVMVWLNIDKMAHSITHKESDIPPRTCKNCHASEGSQRIKVSFAWNADPALVYEGLYKGSFEIVADENGLRIENLDGYKQDGTPSNAFDPMKGKWSVPGNYIIPQISGPATGHPSSQ